MVSLIRHRPCHERLRSPACKCSPRRPLPHRHRPCHERLDAAYICRSTALLCPRTRWWPLIAT